MIEDVQSVESGRRASHFLKQHTLTFTLTTSPLLSNKIKTEASDLALLIIGLGDT
jgi:hypothetical protein